MNDQKSGFFKSRSHREKGSALLMIMTSILLLSFLMVEVIFETTLNKTKIDNLREKFQARLNAESGLTFALAQLRIYKEARKKIDGNKELQKQISPSMLEGMVTRPFKVPIPLGKGAGDSKKVLLRILKKSF